ncbi:MAG: GNAT family N-acetyltransferase [Oscillospiraceae bacterium]|nr:GNAT family N-acetyltransferase [Oscillospiraceae bacterium]
MKWIASISPDHNEFAFVLKDEGKVIGAGSVSLDSERNGYKLGYNLNRKYWNKGYATEASKAMIAWAHDTLGIRYFVAAHASANLPSGKVLKKCGFTFCHFGTYSRFDGSETFDASFYEMRLD